MVVTGYGDGESPGVSSNMHPEHAPDCGFTKDAVSLICKNDASDAQSSLA